ncbi:serine/threonine-protein kinase [Fimbriiglobus ruber]|nr:serine/threonine-protein kinase [Fimbriiglobus ruber]
MSAPDPLESRPTASWPDRVPDRVIVPVPGPGPAQVGADVDENRDTIGMPVDPDPVTRTHNENDAPAGDPATRTNSFPATSSSVPDGVPDIPGYAVEAEIARGGMGVVYRARDQRLNRPVAIKMILGGKYHDPAARVRFLIEAEAIAQLDHPNVVSVYEFGTHDDLPFFALEYVGGGTLASKLAQDGKPAPLAAAELLVKLTDGIREAHAKGIVHRDLKPSNVLLTATGEPKIADFGIAKVGQSDMTATGAVMGTPSYMSPEQAGGRTREVGTPTDVYALGAILYEMLTGRPPFLGESSMATIQQVLNQEPARPRTINPEVSRDLETICLKCLAKDPKQRYGSASELAADLKAFVAGKPIAARPVGIVERAWKWTRRHPARAIGMAAGICLAIGLAVAGYEVHKQREADRQEVNERMNRNDEAVTALLDQCEAALKDGDASRASVAVDAAERRAVEGGVDHLSERIDVLRANVALLKDLDAVDRFRSTRKGLFEESNKIVARYREALKKFGADPNDVAPEAASTKVSETKVKDRLVVVFDYLLGEEKNSEVLATLKLIDPDAFRDAVRDAVQQGNSQKIDELANRPAALDQSPGFTIFMIERMSSGEERRRELFEAVACKRPRDLGLLIASGSVNLDDDEYSPDEQLRWYQAAASIVPESSLAHKMLAEILTRKGDRNGAIIQFREAIRLDPQDWTNHSSLSELLKSSGDVAASETERKMSKKLEMDQYGNKTILKLSDIYMDYRPWDIDNEYLDGVIKNLHKLIHDNPDNAVAQKNMGRIMHALENQDAAIASFHAAIKSAPNDVITRVMLARALSKKGSRIEAIAEYDAAISLEQKELSLRIELVKELMASANNLRAVIELQKMVKLDPKDEGVLEKILEVGGDLSWATSAYQEAIRLNPSEHLCHLHLATIFAKKNDYKSAIAEYREANRLGPSNADICIQFGQSLEKGGDRQSAIAQYRKAVQLNPAFSKIPELMKNNKSNLNWIIEEYQKAIYASPRKIKIRSTYAEILEAQGELDLAIKEYQQIVSFNVWNSTIRLRLASLLLKKGELVWAIAECREAYRLDPDGIYPHTVRSSIYDAIISKAGELNKNGHRNDAIVLYREAIRLDPTMFLQEDLVKITEKRDWAIEEFRRLVHDRLLNTDLAWINLAGALEANNEPDGAIAAYREAIRLHPNESSTHSLLANCLSIKGDQDRAIAEYREAMRLDPRNRNFGLRETLAELLRSKGDNLKSQGDRGVAIVYYREAIRLDPSRFLLDIDEHKGDLNWAVEEYRELVRITPDDHRSRINFAIILAAKDDQAGAIVEYKQAIRVAPNEGFTHYEFAKFLETKGDQEGAITECREAIRLSSNEIKADFSRTLLCRLLKSKGDKLTSDGDLNSVIALYREAVRVDGKDNLTHQKLTQHLESTRDWGALLIVYQETIRLNPNDMEAKTQLTRAEKLHRLQNNLPELLAGHQKLATAAEALEFARLCSRSFPQRYSAASRFYELAFVRDRSLMADLIAGYRYDAARYAMLAASGEGFDAPFGSFDQRALRAKALAWLKEDLEILKFKAASSNKSDRHLAVAQLTHWLGNTDLNETRPGIRRVKMTIVERHSWDTLWNDVRATLTVAKQAPPLEVAPQPRVK